MSHSLTSAILATLTYSDHFHFPLTESEIYQRLIQKSTTKKQLETELLALQKKRQIEHVGIYYCLPGQAILSKQRRIYESMSLPLLDYAKSLIPFLTKLRSIKAIYLTGSLALKNTDGHDDIDLMIITENGKLWTTRALLTLYTTILGLRRTPNSKSAMGKLCLNLYLTPVAFQLPPSRRSLYTAYELIQAIPLYDPSNTHRALLTTNSWIKKYLPNYQLPKKSPKVSPQNVQYSFLEKTLYHFQYLYMKSKITREYITPDAAFFHPHNPGKKVLEKILIVK